MSSTSRAAGAWIVIPVWARRALGVALAGVVWGQAALAVGVLLLPRYLVYGEAVKAGNAYRIVALTALLPWTMAVGIASHASGFLGRNGIGPPDPGLLTALVAPLAACALATGAAVVFRSRRLRWGRLAVGGVVIVAAAVLTLQLADCVRAEREFFALVSQSDTPHLSPRVVPKAESFLAAHPYSRWRSEAIRIGAMAAEASGDDADAERRWLDFGESFNGAAVPGVAYAEYSRARCWERLGGSRKATRHYREAVSIIRGRDDGIQSWIGSDGAIALARIEVAQGRPMRAAYWTRKANDISAASRD